MNMMQAPANSVAPVELVRAPAEATWWTAMPTVVTSGAVLWYVALAAVMAVAVWYWRLGPLGRCSVQLALPLVLTGRFAALGEARRLAAKNGTSVGAMLLARAG